MGSYLTSPVAFLSYSASSLLAVVPVSIWSYRCLKDGCTFDDRFWACQPSLMLLLMVPHFAFEAIYRNFRAHCSAEEAEKERDAIVYFEQQQRLCRRLMTSAIAMYALATVPRLYIEQQ